MGVDGEAIGDITNAGAVNAIYGSNSGLSAANDQIWHQNSPGIEGGAETFDSFGRSLAVGDFNNDGFDDLAVGVDGEDVGDITNAGAVNVIYGSNSGLSATGNEILDQNNLGIDDELAEPFDFFGQSLTVGDFNADGFDDLAVGIPLQDTEAGATNIIYGSLNGLIA